MASRLAGQFGSALARPARTRQAGSGDVVPRTPHFAHVRPWRVHFVELNPPPITRKGPWGSGPRGGTVGQRALRRLADAELTALRLLEPGIVPLGLEFPEYCGVQSSCWRLAARRGPVALLR